MHPFTITLKNYRCFEDSQPLKIEIRPGFTAYVGPNNSGKSSCLRVFYEFRNLFISLQQNLAPLVEENIIHLNEYPSVEDPIELFYNNNHRPIIIQIDFLEIKPNQISRVEITINRATPRQMTGVCFYNKNTNIITTGIIYSNIDFSQLQELCNAVANSLYIGAFRNTISEGHGNYYDLPIGTSFINTWHNWKTGSVRAQNESIQDVTKDLEHIFGYNRLEVNAANEGKTLQIIVDNKPYRIREVGAGLSQFLIVLGYVAIRKPSFVMIDEPELNLHPSLQVDFLTSLAYYTSGGDVIFATHSIGLARTLADRIYSFQKKDHKSTAKLFEQTPNLAEFVGEMSFSSFKEMGHETILLVEGVTEVKAVQQFLRMLKKDHTVVVIPLGGGQLIKAGMQPELAELKRLSSNIAVLIDSERASSTEIISSDRVAFEKDCRELGFEICVTERRAFENYLTERAIQQVKGTSYRALETYQKLEKVSPSWSKNENWQIARAMNFDEIKDTDVGKFLANLK